MPAFLSPNSLQDGAMAGAQDTAAPVDSLVASDAPLPLPYLLEDGTKKPLLGAQSVFLTSKIAA